MQRQTRVISSEDFEARLPDRLQVGDLHAGRWISVRLVQRYRSYALLVEFDGSISDWSRCDEGATVVIATDEGDLVYVLSFGLIVRAKQTGASANGYLLASRWEEDIDEFLDQHRDSRLITPPH